MIRFNIPPYVGKEKEYVCSAIDNKKLCGDGDFTKRCTKLISDLTGSGNVLLTTSCTHALEMSALLCDIKPGDEVIMSSFTFSSTANAFVLRGAKIVFTDIRPDTMNMDEELIEDAITPRTRAIVVMHYAGISCDMDKIMALAKAHNLYVVEDAAQGFTCTYKGRQLGTIGDIGCYSFHETKNFSMGEGGAITVNSKTLFEDAEILREKGTDRSRFFLGLVDKYSWVNYGSSYIPSELNAAYLLAQLEEADKINENRLKTWNTYHEELLTLEKQEKLVLPTVPEYASHNAHMFYIKCKDLSERTDFISYMKKNEINCVFHYVPLHSSTAGRRFGTFHGEDRFITKESDRLVRLPLYYGLSEDDCLCVCEKVKNFFKG